MEIFGHCRFSWFGISDTGREIADIEAARGLLWHPERMAVRFHLFETIMLPSMRAQSDRDFRLLVLISEDLPAIYRDRLEMLSLSTGVFELLPTMERDIGRALRPVMRASVASGGKAVHFRIDDDDALCSDYVSKLRGVAEHSDFPTGTAISFPNGIASFVHAGQARHVSYHKSYVAAGLAFVSGEDNQRNPFQVQHRQVGKRQRSFVDPTFMAFQVTLHNVNNTRGYDRVVHDSNSAGAGVDRLLRNNPEIAGGARVDPKLDQMIDKAFAPATGTGLRAALEKTSDPRILADTFGFH